MNEYMYATIYTHSTHMHMYKDMKMNALRRSRVQFVRANNMHLLSDGWFLCAHLMHMNTPPSTDYRGAECVRTLNMNVAQIYANHNRLLSASHAHRAFPCLSARQA